VPQAGAQGFSKQGAVATVKSTLPRREIENRASGSVPLRSIESTQRWHSVNVSSGIVALVLPTCPGRETATGSGQALHTCRPDRGAASTLDTQNSVYEFSVIFSRRSNAPRTQVTHPHYKNGPETRMAGHRCEPYATILVFASKHGGIDRFPGVQGRPVLLDGPPELLPAATGCVAAAGWARGQAQPPGGPCLDVGAEVRAAAARQNAVVVDAAAAAPDRRRLRRLPPLAAAEDLESERATGSGGGGGLGGAAVGVATGQAAPRRVTCGVETPRRRRRREGRDAQHLRGGGAPAAAEHVGGEAVAAAAAAGGRAVPRRPGAELVPVTMSGLQFTSCWPCGRVEKFLL
jgi:hypothetical protein